MRVAETTETLDYIKGSKKPRKVGKSYTQFYTELLRLRVLVFPSPSIGLSVGGQTAFRASLCLCRYKVFDRRKARACAKRIGRVIVVRGTKPIGRNNQP